MGGEVLQYHCCMGEELGVGELLGLAGTMFHAGVALDAYAFYLPGLGVRDRTHRASLGA